MKLVPAGTKLEKAQRGLAVQVEPALGQTQHGTVALREALAHQLVDLAREPVAHPDAKIVLDLRLTLERLESLSVPVLGYGCDELPAFYTKHSGCPVGTRVDGPEEAAAVVKAVWETGGRGIVIAIPPPSDLDGAEELVQRAVGELAGVTGPALTPRLLARVAELSGGRSLEVNVELVVNNARIAAQVAARY